MAVFAGLTVAVRAHGPDEDDVLPIWSGRMPEAPDPSKLKRTAPLGGKTLGEELGKRMGDAATAVCGQLTRVHPAIFADPTL